MIIVSLNEHGIRMNGHAGYHKNGQDIVCAAISALTCNLINSLLNLSEDKIREESRSGMTVIEWQELSDKGKLLVDSWFIGIVAINQKYHCITFV